MATLPIQLPHEAIAQFCDRWHIRKLSLFGSVLTPRFREDSDVDILVEFDPGRTPGFFEISSMETELSGMLGRKVDLRTLEELSRYFRDEISQTAIAEYERR
jgi:uncharacterized protein